MASIVDPALKAATGNNTLKFTVFAPNDSYIMTMPKYGQDRLFSATSWNLLKSVSTFLFSVNGTCRRNFHLVTCSKPLQYTAIFTAVKLTIF